MGFQSYDQITNALTVNNKGQEIFFSKTAPAAQVANVSHSAWMYTGIPTAGAVGATGGAAAATLDACDNTTVGAIPFVSPTTISGEKPHIISIGALPTTAVAGTLMLVDRLAHTGVITTGAGASCTITMPVGSAWPRYADGVGVMAYFESGTAASSAGSVCTITYTNTVPTASRISSTITTANASHRAFGSTGTFADLQAGDLGIKSIQSVTVQTVAAAGIALVVCKPLLILPCVTAGYYTERDLVIQTPKLPQLQVSADTSACLQWIFLPRNSATIPTIMGSVSLVTG